MRNGAQFELAEEENENENDISQDYRPSDAYLLQEIEYKK